MIKSSILTSALVLCVTGCINVDATRLSGSEMLAPIQPRDVTIYTSPEQVPGSYRQIALLEANGDGTVTSERDFHESMRKKAAKLGANGIILEPGLEPSPTVKIASTLLDVRYTRYRHAIAVFVDAPAK